MKKILSMLFILIATLVLVGCGSSKVTEEVKVITPQGNPFIAVGNLIGEENITIDSVNGAAGVQAALIANEYDVVIAPLNLGAKLYVNGKSKYQLNAVIALGNTYIISKTATTLSSVQDLNGKTIIAYSQGGTPDIILQQVLKANNVTAEIEYVAGASDVLPLFMQGKYDYALAAEPVITNLKVNKKLELNVLNLQDYIDTTIMQAAIFVNSESTKQDSIKALIKKIEKNIKDMNNYPEEYANSIVSKDTYFSGLGVEIISKSLPNTNLDFLDAKDNKDKIEGYLTMIGQTLPNEDFYQ